MFAFTIPMAARLVVASFSLTAASNTEPTFALLEGSLEGASGTVVDVFFAFPGQEDVSTKVPLDANAYNVYERGFSAPIEGAAIGEYTFSFTVEPSAAVPEPRWSLALGIGAIGLAAMLRRVRRAHLTR